MKKFLEAKKPDTSEEKMFSRAAGKKLFFLLFIFLFAFLLLKLENID